MLHHDEANARLDGTLDAMQVVHDALAQHIRVAHPDHRYPHDKVCDTCRQLVEREQHLMVEMDGHEADARV